MGLRDRSNTLAIAAKFALAAAATFVFIAPAYALLGSSTSVISSTNPSSFGASVTFTATVTGLIVTPTGTVTFKDGATTLGTGTLNGSGQASFSTTTLATGSHSITAVYGGDVLYNASTSPVLTQSVVANATSTTVISSVNPSALNQSVIFTATVTSPGGTPTGTVTFMDGATTLGTGTLDGSGQTTFASSLLLPGNHSITAVYSGDSNFSAGVSPVLTQTVNLGTSSTAVISSANPSTVGQSVTFTATVSGLVIQPTGTVTFKDGAATLGTGNINASGQATFTTSALGAGSHSITAVYGGDTIYNSSTSNLLTQQVNQTSTATAVVSSANPSASGASVTFTATVTSSGGTPTGTVTFMDGVATLGTGSLDGSGQATLSTSGLSIGAHSITAVYGGDANFTGSTSPVLTQNVTSTASATALVSSANPSAFGASVTFTATVTGSGGTPTGTVTFKDGATTLGNGTLDGSGQTTFSTSTLAAGSHSITAVYNGDGTFGVSTSPVLTQVVNSNSSATSLVSSVNPSAYGASVTFTATVTGSGGTPTGTVTFKDGAATLGTGTLNGSGQATLSTSSLAAGSHSITAVYGGDSNFTTSTSPVLTQVVGQNAASVALTSSVNPSTLGQAVTFTATVTSSGGTPTGTVTFKDGSTVIGTTALSGNTATLTISSLTAGTHSITASYGGDANFSAATSAALSQSVGVPRDSVNLRALQIKATRIAAQNSGAAVSDAIDSAISEGFADGCTTITTNRSGLRFTFGDQRCTTRRANNGFAASEAIYPQWLLWNDTRVAEWNTNVTQGDLTGRQVNTLVGVTNRLSTDLLAGLFAGYEMFNYSSESLSGHLHGDGWTVGGYVGWRLRPGLRADFGVARSGVTHEAAAGTAAASFTASRTLFVAGLTGTYKMAHDWEIEPSARIYALLEQEGSYTDSLGTVQASRNFYTGRASVGAKVIYRWLWSDTVILAPYLGLYADQYFTQDDATPSGTAPAIEGSTIRVVSGASLTTGLGSQFTVATEVGGLGGNFTTWSLRGRASIAF
jgi:Bacterial Ig-like domain (group 3)